MIGGKTAAGRAVAALVAVGAASPAWAAAHRYDNAKYGFSVALPAGADVCGPAPPQPNHGVLFRPRGVTSPPCDGDVESGARYTVVDAHYAPDGEPADVGALARAECPRLAFDSRGRVRAVSPPPFQGGMDRAACRIDGADGSVGLEVFARRAASGATPAIDYTLGLKSTRFDYPSDSRAFAVWLRTVRFFLPL